LQQGVLLGIDKLATRVRPKAKADTALPPHLLTGLRGEEEALFHLRQRGYVIVARQWRTPRLPGDIDLIGWDGDTLCFIEVKTRTGRDIVPAEFAVDEHKRELLRRLACVFQKRFPESARRQMRCRFDVVSVYLPPPEAGPNRRVEIDLFPAAFPVQST
jgi:putative endonuclease